MDLSTENVVATQVIFGLNKRGPVLDTTFVSQTVAEGNTSTPCPATANYVSITPMTANVFVAFAVGANTANASQDPRVWIPAGSTASFSCVANTKVAVITG